MPTELTAREAYLAGGHDFEVAAEQTRKAVKSCSITKAQAGKYFVDAIEHLWQGRIERGELVPEWITQERAA